MDIYFSPKCGTRDVRSTQIDAALLHRKRQSFSKAMVKCREGAVEGRWACVEKPREFLSYHDRLHPCAYLLY
jgi:hypothetical protein